MNHLTLSILIVVAVVLYGGLGVLFYDPETGFSWLYSLLGASALVIAGIVFFIRRDLNKLRSQERDIK